MSSLFSQIEMHGNIQGAHTFLSDELILSDNLISYNYSGKGDLELGLSGSSKYLHKLRWAVTLGLAMADFTRQEPTAKLIDTTGLVNLNDLGYQNFRISYMTLGIGAYYKLSKIHKNFSIRAMLKFNYLNSAKSTIYQYGPYPEIQEDIKAEFNNVVPSLSILPNFKINALDFMAFDFAAGIDLRPMQFHKSHKNRSFIAFNILLGARIRFAEFLNEIK